MKKESIVFLITLSIVLMGATAINYLGGANSTVEVRGGMHVDSALQLPIFSTTAKYIGKGADTTGLIFISTTDSLLHFMKNGVVKRVRTGFDVQTWDTTGLTVNATDTVRSYSIPNAGSYLLTGYVNITSYTSGSITMTVNFKAEDLAIKSKTLLFCTNTTVIAAPNSGTYFTAIPFTIHSPSDGKIWISINTGSNLTTNAGFVLTRQ